MTQFKNGDLIRANKTMIRMNSGIVAGRVYRVAQVRVDTGDLPDLKVEGQLGWWGSSAFELETDVPADFAIGKHVRRMKASHRGVTQGATYKIADINRRLGLIRLEGVSGSFRAASFQLADDGRRTNAFGEFVKPAPKSRTVGWRNEDGEITVNPNVAALWVTGGAKAKVERVYVEAA